MALTSTTSFDIVGQTQTLTFNNPGQIDQVSFANNQITFQAETQYSLAKSDMILWFKYLNAFNNLLLINFPSISSSIGQIFPLCVFSIVENNIGVKKITYDQQISGTEVLNIVYVPLAAAASVATRASPVTISLQEWFMTVLMMNQFTQQVALN